MSSSAHALKFGRHQRATRELGAYSVRTTPRRTAVSGSASYQLCVTHSTACPLGTSIDHTGSNTPAKNKHNHKLKPALDPSTTPTRTICPAPPWPTTSRRPRGRSRCCSRRRRRCRTRNRACCTSCSSSRTATRRRCSPTRSSTPSTPAARARSTWTTSSSRCRPASAGSLVAVYRRRCVGPFLLFLLLLPTLLLCAHSCCYVVHSLACDADQRHPPPLCP